jgi:hypothetical protein
MFPNYRVLRQDSSCLSFFVNFSEWKTKDYGVCPNYFPDEFTELGMFDVDEEISSHGASGWHEA